MLGLHYVRVDNGNILVSWNTLSCPTLPFQVSTNGALSFGERLQSYSGERLSMVNTALVAPFWADVDTREIGEVFHRQTNEPKYVAMVKNDIDRRFENAHGYAPSILFIATWNSVSYSNKNTDHVSICS